MSKITTYTKKHFDPLHPDTDLLDIHDIAHALSMLCRANGHFKSFYSVGQHSINCAREAFARNYSAKVQLACLLHDASEAFLSDITRPVKAQLTYYREIEASLQQAVWNKWLPSPLTEEECNQISEIDNALLAHEFLVLMAEPLSPCLPQISSHPSFHFTNFADCEQEFLHLFDLLSRKLDFFVVGIDWMSPFWLAVEIRGEVLSFKKLYDISEINTLYADADAILIDIPIGLPEDAPQAQLRPDNPARGILPSSRKSTVFPTPCRQAIYTDSYTKASTMNEQILGKRLTGQSYGFSSMIRQVDAFLSNNSSWKNKLMESHPEIAFRFLNNGNGPFYSKHTPEGIHERCNILSLHLIDPTPLLRQFHPKKHEDVLDALSLAVSAKLGCQSGFHTIPACPATDNRGLLMQMVFGS